jgi:hypothetical protein
MPDNRSDKSLSARRLAILFLAVCLIAAFGLSQALAAPFVYMPESGVFGAVAVIDTATNTVVATIMVPINGSAAAITPYGKRV